MSMPPKRPPKVRSETVPARRPPQSDAPEIDIDSVTAELRKVLSFNLRMARMALRMTQRDLSNASGISQKHISAIEMATANVSIDVIAALTHALHDVTPADLLTPPARRLR